MEIIHLILGKANPERMNGVNRVVHEMATVQTKYNYRVQVWGITANTVHDYPVRNFITRLFKSSKNPFKISSSLKNAFIEKKGNIVVHIHGAFLPRFYTATKFLQQHKIPFIITPHSSYNDVMMKKNAVVKNLYFTFFEKHVLNKASKIHLLGQTEWNGLDKIYHNRKSTIIPYGFQRKIKEPVIEKFPVFTVAYCGRFSVFSKGLDILLEGFANFHALHPASKLVIIGDGKEKDMLVSLATKLNIENALLFTGSLFGNDKVNLLKQCHVFAHPSRTDGIPATIVEAASLGLPCIVSTATNTGDYITEFDAGYTMQNLSAPEFSQGLQIMHERIMHKNEQPVLKQNAFDMIDKVFNWKNILNQFDHIYEKAMQHAEPKSQQLSQAFA